MNERLSFLEGVSVMRPAHVWEEGGVHFTQIHLERDLFKKKLYFF